MSLRSKNIIPHNDLSTLPFEKKIKLLDDWGKTCTGELIDWLLAERHEKRQLSTPNGGEKPQKTSHILCKQNPVWDFK